MKPELAVQRAQVNIAYRRPPFCKPGIESAGQGLVRTLAIMLFLLAAANGNPAWWSSGVFLAALAPAVILVRGLPKLLNIAFSRPYADVSKLLILFTLCNWFSVFANQRFETFEAFFERCFAPFLLYLCAIGLRLKKQDQGKLIVAFASGVLFMFARGLLAYYNEFGIPDFETLMWSRFNVLRIASYSAATLGNVTNMGSYVVMTVPPLIYAAAFKRQGLRRRVLLVITVVFGIGNLLVSGSRTGMVLLPVSLILIILALGARAFWGGFVLLAATFYATADFWAGLLDDPHVVERFLPSMGASGLDESAQERYQSVVEGWEVFLDNPTFGVGPGMSFEHNYWTAPHESIVLVLSEVGVFGGLVFAILNIVIVWAMFKAAFRARHSEEMKYRFLWLLGPAFWCVYGLLAGLAFSATFSLVWIGMFHVMVALAFAGYDHDEGHGAAPGL